MLVVYARLGKSNRDCAVKFNLLGNNTDSDIPERPENAVDFLQAHRLLGSGSRRGAS